MRQGVPLFGVVGVLTVHEVGGFLRFLGAALLHQQANTDGEKVLTRLIWLLKDPRRVFEGGRHGLAEVDFLLSLRQAVAHLERQ